MPASDDPAFSPFQRIFRIARAISLPAILLIDILSGGGPAIAQQHTQINAIIKLRATPDLPKDLPQDRVKCWAEVRKGLQEARGEALSEMRQLLKTVPTYCSKPLGKASKRAKNCQRKIRSINKVAQEFNDRAALFDERTAKTKPVDLRTCSVCGRALISGIRERLANPEGLRTYIWQQLNMYRGCSLCGCKETAEYGICNRALPNCYRFKEKAAFQACVNSATRVGGI